MPKLLDLFCGAGGCSVGYHRAGFDVTGVDLYPQPRYPYQFIQSDALEYLADHWREYDVIHASPPCQGYSDLRHRTGKEYPKLIDDTRDQLIATGKPYIIENVEGAPLDGFVLCGTMFGLRVIRHRIFETSVSMMPPLHPSDHPLVFTYDKRKAHFGKLDQNTAFVQVTGGGNCTVKNKRAAMGIDWMAGKEINQAIPPAYTEWIGKQLMEAIYA